MSRLTKTKRWRTFLLELSAVFIGVMAAFLLNSWRENRQISYLEASHLQSITSDLLHDRQSLEAAVETAEEHASKLGEFLYYRDDEWTIDSTYEVVANTMAIVDFSGTSTTYESLKFSGQLSYIQDIELRAKVIEYYEKVSDVRTVERLYFDWITGNLVPYYIEHLDMAALKFMDPSTADELAFRNRMIGLHVLLIQKLQAYREQIEANEQLVEIVGQ